MGYESVYTPPSWSAGTFSPPASNTYDLGSTSAEWRALYLGEGASSGAYFGTDQHARVYSDGTDLIVALSSGNIDITGADLSIAATKKFYLDGGGDTYIHEVGADRMQFVVKDTTYLEINASGDVGLYATSKLFLDGVAGSGDTYIHESASDVLDLVVGGITMVSIPDTGSIVIDNATNQVLSLHEHSSGSSMFRVEFQKSRGTHASPTTVVTSDDLGQFQVSAHDGTSYVRSADMKFEAIGTIDTGQVPTRFAIRLMNTSGVIAERFNFTADGDFAINTTNKLYLDGVAGSGDTYIHESSPDVLDLVAGGVTIGSWSTTGLDINAGAASAAYTLETTLGAGNAIVNLVLPASGVGGSILNLRQGNGSGSANNMQYSLGYDATLNYYRLRSNDSDGGGTNGDVYRVADGGVSVQFQGAVTSQGSIDSAAVADEVSLGGFDLSAGNRALAISQEAVVIAEVDESLFNEVLPVRINGVTKYVMLTTLTP